MDIPKSKTKEYTQNYNRMYYLKKNGEKPKKVNWKNEEERKEYFREYQKQHKDRYSEIHKTTLTCQYCLKVITKQSLSNHKRSQYHLNAVNIRNLIS